MDRTNTLTKFLVCKSRFIEGSSSSTLALVIIESNRSGPNLYLLSIPQGRPKNIRIIHPFLFLPFLLSVGEVKKCSRCAHIIASKIDIFEVSIEILGAIMTTFIPRFPLKIVGIVIDFDIKVKYLTHGFNSLRFDFTL